MPRFLSWLPPMANPLDCNDDFLSNPIALHVDHTMKKRWVSNTKGTKTLQEVGRRDLRLDYSLVLLKFRGNIGRLSHATRRSE